MSVLTSSRFVDILYTISNLSQFDKVLHTRLAHARERTRERERVRNKERERERRIESE
jgi:hypothetical protein